MSSGRSRGVVGPLGARLTLWFSFVISVCLLFVLGISYYLLSASLRDKDRELIRTKWKDYSETVAMDGVGSLRGRIVEDLQSPGAIPFVVAFEHEGDPVFLYIPKALKHFDVSKPRAIESKNGSAETWHEYSAKNGGDSLEAFTAQVDGHAALTVGKSTWDRREALQKFQHRLLFAIVPILLLGCLAGFAFSRKALRPIRALSATARSIYEGDIAARVPVTHTGDELEELGNLFNRMLDRIQALMDGMRDTLDNVAHDLRTPMTRFRGLAEMGLVSGTADEQKAALSECLDCSEDILRMLNTLMDLSCAEAGVLKLNFERVDLAEVAGEAAELYRLLADEKEVQLAIEADCHVWVWADRIRLAQAIANLFDNALKYTPSGGSIAAKVTIESGNGIFRISDTGCGIPERDLPRIWERLYRGDRSRSQKGMGLGLSIVRATIQAHHGQITVESEEGTGSRFLVAIPSSEFG